MKQFFRTTIYLLLLQCVGFGSNAPGSSEVLERVRKQVTGFLDLFSEVKCTETVAQKKLAKNGKVEYQEQSRYDYLLIAQSSDTDLNLQESRLEEQASTKKKNVPLLVTNGFATLLLIFHPYYQDSFEYLISSDEVFRGERARRILFRHIGGTRSPSVLVLRGREYPLELTGTAWVNPETGEIRRIQAQLQTNMDDLGLRVFKSDVIYLPITFRGMKAAPWLPAEANIEVQTARQHWQNIHRFSNYQHFAVSTEESAKGPADNKASN
jgi:hypothetical protein